MMYMIAGPNGAGKTTAAMRLLPDFLSIHEFVNADEIARGLNPLNADGQAVLAGRLMLKRMDDLIASHKNFAFETTGASRIFADKLRRARATGYHLGLLYLWLPSAAFAAERVRRRVQQGGHDIPRDTIERRYHRSLQNLTQLYLPLVDDATLLDSTLPTTDGVDIIAQKQGAGWQIHKHLLWNTLQRSVGDQE